MNFKQGILQKTNQRQITQRRKKKIKMSSDSIQNQGRQETIEKHIENDQRKKIQPRKLQPVKLYFKNEDKMKASSDNQT